MEVNGIVVHMHVGIFTNASELAHTCTYHGPTMHRLCKQSIVLATSISLPRIAARAHWVTHDATAVHIGDAFGDGGRTPGWVWAKLGSLRRRAGLPRGRSMGMSVGSSGDGGAHRGWLWGQFGDHTRGETRGPCWVTMGGARRSDHAKTCRKSKCFDEKPI